MQKKIVAKMLLGLFVFALAGNGFLRLDLIAHADAAHVVINEVNWAGSADSSSDEWIELYNPGTADQDLTGWTISYNKGASIYKLAGTIKAGSYYLIERREIAVNPNVADLVVSMSLVNTGASLVLIDNNGQQVDVVNSAGGMWPAGDSKTHATMERVNPLTSGDVASNWQNSTGAGSTATSSNGSLILGTPGIANSVGQVLGTQNADTNVNVALSKLNPADGDVVTATVSVAKVQDLFSYGLEVVFDPNVLNLQSVTKGSFLSENGAISTAFESAEVSGQPGHILIAEVRTQTNKTTVSGDGVLCTLQFVVNSDPGKNSQIGFGTRNFLAGLNGDLTGKFNPLNFQIDSAVSLQPVTGLSAAASKNRYAIDLNWQPVGAAEGYKVYRQDQHGDFVLLGQTLSTTFTDSDTIAKGGKIIPGVNYNYKVTAYSGANESDGALIMGVDLRGIKGDNDRSDLVDGRDLLRIAKLFGKSDADAGFDALVDTNYDGQIDGSDLIDVGANFAKSFN